MPAEMVTEATRMLTAGAIVAAVALPVGFLGRAVARRRSEPLVPGWKPWRVPWGGFEVAAAFLIFSTILPEVVSQGLSQGGFFQQVYGPDFPGPRAQPLPPVEASAAAAGFPAAHATHAAVESAVVLRQSWAGAVALPLQLGLFYLATRALYPTWRRPHGPGLGASLALAVAAWAVLAPLVLALNVVVNLAATLLDAPPEQHSFTNFAGRMPFDPALFLFRVSVCAAVVEELVFRGVILTWVLGGRKPQPVPDLPSDARPWLVAGAGVMFAALSGRGAAVGFAVLLAAGLFVLLWRCRSKRRTVGAVWASAAFFATVHSAVWPSPVPLFVLGLGLGWLAVRTRGVLVPAVVHGLFNAVSGVYVLRGGAG